VLIEVGEEMPADGKLLEAVALQVNESRLTGESVPANKRVGGEADKSDHATTYARDQMLRGTMVVDGHGVAELTAVGDHTEIGKTARAAMEETDEQTPLNKQLEKLSKVIGVVGLGAAMITFGALVVRGAWTGELAMSPQQWLIVLLLIASVLVALVRVWMPILFDAIEFAGKELKQPAWLENDSLIGWLITFGVGAAVFAIGLLVLLIAGQLPLWEDGWIPTVVGNKLLLYFMIAVTIIVVAVPEGLAMSVTLSLAYSMRKMTAENNLVRRMHACETIGAATVICSDKTGTLTLNEMRVADMNFPSVDGEFGPNGQLGNPERLIVEGITANTTAHLSRTDGEGVKPLGNPTEGALLLWLDSHGIDYIIHRTEFPVDFQLTFSTERKYMATMGVSPVTGKKILHVKGAPELILSKCTNIATRDGNKPVEEMRESIQSSLKDYQRRAMRTLGMAYREISPEHNNTEVEHLVENLTWLGFAAIADPVRPEVPAAIEACNEAGVKVKIVTGDNQETAREIAIQIGLWKPEDSADQHITGPEFGALDEAQAAIAVKNLKVLSRARPTDKMRLVRLLQAQNEVVAVTGDGTNDAPALNHANVGLAMGKTGTSVAKEASDIILLDDSFRSIVNAIMWGRSLYLNIQRFILFQLTINVVALTIAVLGPFIGIELPLTVMQMLWVNLIMDTFAALALATEPASPDVLKRPPRHPDDFIVTKEMAYIIFGVGGLFLVVLIAFLFIIKGGDAHFDVTAEANRRALSLFFSTFVLLQFWNLFNARTLGTNHSAFTGLEKNLSFSVIAGAILLGQILLVQLGGTVFRTEALSFLDWVIIIACTSIVLWVGEVWRYLKRQKEGPEAESAFVKADGKH
jgi:Ca2+-transporting ATPase